ncbi:MAG: xanthine dehydrogenase family protein molybdopterin-binding subunit, partial [Alphaproteobacteria bacterium]
EINKPTPRVDGPTKVAGLATYAGEFHPDGLAYAAWVPATIAHGRIDAVDVAEALAAPGVLAVLTHENAPRLPFEPIGPPVVDPDVGEQIRPLQTTEIRFAGQPVALVVAESQTAARDAARLVRVTETATPGVGLAFDPERAHAPGEATDTPPATTAHAEPDGDISDDGAMRTESTVEQPRIHHAAMEPHVTIAAWDGDGRLTLWDKSQWVGNVRHQIARNFGLADDHVRVISPFVGGAFGSALRTWPHVAAAAVAARVVGRPVRLELTRRELFTAVGYRPRTRQTVKLTARPDGHLLAIDHTAFAETSAYEDYEEEVTEPAGALYDAASVTTRHGIVALDTNTPTPMRGPGVVTGVLALETAMDDMADALALDPLDFRRRNDAERHPTSGLPFSSKALRACYDVGAERFGWAARPRARRAMRHHGELVGYGMATAIWPSHRAPSSAAVTLFDNGTAVVRTAASDMGPGTYTSMTQVAADRLGLPVERVTFELGDSKLPTAPVHGGSLTMASVGNAVASACEALRTELAERTGGEAGDDPVATLRELRLDRLEVEGRAAPGGEATHHAAYAFGAVFAEVRVDAELGTVRVPRLVGAYDGGVIVNPLTAKSQAIGGMVQGIGMALMEEAAWDERLGRVMNADLAGYHVPVNADVETLDATFVESADYTFNPLGVKGIAEIALCGVAPAIANALWHATDRRIRTLPFTPDRLIAANALD